MSSIAPHLRPLVYVDTDIPMGLTITDWRRARQAATPPTTRLRRLARRAGF